MPLVVLLAMAAAPADTAKCAVPAFTLSRPSARLPETWQITGVCAAAHHGCSTVKFPFSPSCNSPFGITPFVHAHSGSTRGARSGSAAHASGASHVSIASETIELGDHAAAG